MIAPLETLPLVTRLVIGLAAAVFTLILIALLNWFNAGAEEAYRPSKYENELLELEKQAIDEAFKKHMVRLFEIWVTDYQPTQPPRAVHGARNAREAYTRSLERLEQRGWRR